MAFVRTWLGMNIQRATTGMGIFYYLDEDHFIAGELRNGLAWETHVLRAVLASLPADGPFNVIDVGAHIGTHTIPYSRWASGRGVVHAFEPQAVMAELLSRNVEANGCSAGVEIHRVAVGHVDGAEVSLEDVIHDGPNWGQPYRYETGREFNYGGLQLGVGGPKVFMRTLDSFAFTDVALLKVDAEGSEPLVLWGARELIRRCRPRILFERNDKCVSESMMAMIEIPEEVRTFRIEDYASTLGYAGPRRVGDIEWLLEPGP